MIHQCVSEDLWFRDMLAIDVAAPPLPKLESRREFVRRYAEDSGKRLEELQKKDASWWEAAAQFFDVVKSRAWIMTRPDRLADADKPAWTPSSPHPRNWPPSPPASAPSPPS